MNKNNQKKILIVGGIVLTLFISLAVGNGFKQNNAEPANDSTAKTAKKIFRKTKPTVI